ncbi:MULTISPECIES: glycosyltransferase family 4 protein [unclassified Nocardioides]|uniref:glycosyltransferase family 4 protein n=1 Tax=unclassified Nocardioides TaxID=2615069 RepID=UPI0024053080|nr:MULTISPECIES: glycosyltransferase family 4 protein [unclassified Nocardioides]MDF9715605.1 glycosyltransferase family 4 protein [Nocardioides sp. ChNu-99]
MRGRHVVFTSWRDTLNPEGGGAERYLEQVATGLAAQGARVTVFSAAYPGAPRREVRDGVHHVHAGTKTTVYLWGFWLLLTGRLGRPDVVVDVQNGLPFLTRLAVRCPVVVLVHHVHREQWPVVYPGVTGRFGWWVERWLAPRVYRRSRYVAVSEATRDELAQLGVDRERVTVVHNGTDTAPPTEVQRADVPTICVVGRLVPHKQVEHAIDAVALLRAALPDLRLVVVGSGWWSDELVDHAEARGVADAVVFEGQVDEQRKHELYASSWVMAVPSLKEGWGLVIVEAGSHGVPTVAYAAAGGTRESVLDGESGLLVDTFDEFTEALRRVLTDEQLRGRLGAGARLRAGEFTWEHAQSTFARVLAGEISCRRTR